MYRFWLGGTQNTMTKHLNNIFDNYPSNMLSNDSYDIHVGRDNNVLIFYEAKKFNFKIYYFNANGFEKITQI